MANPNRALVTLPKGVWAIIKYDLKGKIGDSDSEVIRNIVIAYLTEKGYFQASNQHVTKEDNDRAKKTIQSRLDINEAMILTLLTMLEEEQIIKGSVFGDRANEKNKSLQGRKDFTI
jgi:hypothetical protein